MITKGIFARGRQAKTPVHISARGWWDILRRVWKTVGDQNLSILAAGVAFYALLAIFPAMAAIITVYALVADPQTVVLHLAQAEGILPGDVLSIFDEQLLALASRPAEGLSIKLLVGVLFAVWSAHKGVDALVAAIGVAYHEPETRGVIRLKILTYLLTLAAVLFAIIILILLVILPSVTALLPTPSWWKTLVPLARWVTFIAIVSFTIGVLYRYAPARNAAQWKWLSTGAVTATILWLIGSVAFSFYVSSFGTYNETYGTLGAIVVLLLWFFISSYAVILGAALNAEMEHQTKRDTTQGPDSPIGQRGAVVADNLGPIPE